MFRVYAERKGKKKRGSRGGGRKGQEERILLNIHHQSLIGLLYSVLGGRLEHSSLKTASASKVRLAVNFLFVSQQKG